MSYHEELRRRRNRFFGNVLFRLGLLFNLRHWHALGRRGLRAIGRAAAWVVSRCRYRIGWNVRDLFRVWIPYGWRWATNGGLRPWIKGPEFLEPDEFIALVQRYRPRTLSHHFWKNPSSEWHTINFFFRKGRMIYATVLPFHLESMGYYPDALPEPFFKACLGSRYDRDVRTSLTRDPAGRLEREADRAAIPRVKNAAA